MANIIEKMLNVDLLLALGMLLAFIDQASYIPDAISGVLAPYAGIGYLLIVVGAGMALYNMLAGKKR